ncbi:MAG: hypothetical protein JW966_13065 [Anaerolineae bacterium]|nr:hypothetical protein [Anaerolineae bacterium]
MKSGLDIILWEDLNAVQTSAQHTLESLHKIMQVIEKGNMDQPNHEDSQRLNRLVVLAELMNREIGHWSVKLGLSTNGHSKNGQQK